MSGGVFRWHRENIDTQPIAEDVIMLPPWSCGTTKKRVEQTG
jgi:hypothetical protein